MKGLGGVKESPPAPRLGNYNQLIFNDFLYRLGHFQLERPRPEAGDHLRQCAG